MTIDEKEEDLWNNYKTLDDEEMEKKNLNDYTNSESGADDDEQIENPTHKKKLE